MVPNGWSLMKIDDLLEQVRVPVQVEKAEYYREIGIRSHGRGIFHKDPVLGESLGNKRVFKVVPDCFTLNIVFAWEQAVATTSDEEEGFIASHRFPQYKAKDNAACIDFLHRFFLSPRGKYLLGIASPGGAGRNKTLGQKEFGRVVIPTPPFPEQKKIARILSTWDKAIETVDKLIENSQQQKKALMQQLLTGKKRLTGFSGEWKKVRLKEIAEILVSNVDKKSNPKETAVMLCNYTDVYYNDYITGSINFMQATAKKSEIQKFQLKKGDVVVTKDSETPGDIAIPALVDEDIENLVCGYHLAIIRPRRKLAVGDFLAALFSMPETRYYFFTLANGATRFGLNISSIQNARFNVPDIEEQKAISARIRALNDIIAGYAMHRDNIASQKQSLMQQLLTGKRRVKVDDDRSLAHAG